jgi:dihydrofolate synthase/folylpolyglutamate synthase
MHPSPPLSPDEARAFWYGLINYEQRPPAPDDLRLEPMRRLLARLGDPHRRLRVVHVAGTKGKGSTAAMLAAILRQSGYRTGLFTSPHLCRVEERFQVDGRPITAPELTALLNEIYAAVAPSGGAEERRSGGGKNQETAADSPDVFPPPLLRSSALPLTFFEAATAVGFLHFVRRRADVAVVEVGLGGRFDSTNVCRPAVALITSISLDHTRQLGDRVAAIAREKAGIIKPGRPAVSGATAPEARAVVERVCRDRGAPLRRLGVDFHYDYEPGWVGRDAADDRRPRVRVTARRRWPALELSLLGEHQAANAAVAVACVEALREQGWRIPDTAVATGLAGVEWPARMETVGRRPLVVLDCAHNPASAEALVKTLLESFPPGRRLLVFAGSADKDLAGMFRVLAPHFAHAFLTRFLGSARGTPPAELARLLREAGGPPATLCDAPAAAWEAARAAAGPDDMICVTGSVFLAGELRPLAIGPSEPEA